MGFNKFVNLFLLSLLLSTIANESFASFDESSFCKRSLSDFGRPHVTLYENYDFSSNGRNADFILYKHACVNLEYPFNKIASVIRVEYGCAKFYEKLNCKGWMFDLANKVKRLSDKHNDKIQSVSNCVVVAARVVLFEHYEFAGREKALTVYNQGCVHIPFPYYKLVSSARVLKGCVKFYENVNCEGWSTEVSNNDYEVPFEMNDQIKSISACSTTNY